MKAYEDGWTEEGVQYYDEKVMVVKGVMENEPLWENVKLHWRTYLRENRRSSFVHIAASYNSIYNITCPIRDFKIPIYGIIYLII